MAALSGRAGLRVSRPRLRMQWQSLGLTRSGRPGRTPSLTSPGRCAGDHGMPVAARRRTPCAASAGALRLKLAGDGQGALGRAGSSVRVGIAAPPGRATTDSESGLESTPAHLSWRPRPVKSGPAARETP